MISYLPSPSQPYDITSQMAGLCGFCKYMFDNLPAHRDVAHPICTKCSGMIRFQDRQALEVHLKVCRGSTTLGFRNGKQGQPSIVDLSRPSNLNQHQSEPAHQKFLYTTSTTPSGQDYVDGSWSLGALAQVASTPADISSSVTFQEGPSAVEAPSVIATPGLPTSGACLEEAQHLKHDSPPSSSESDPDGSQLTDEQQLLTITEEQLEQLSLQPAPTPNAHNSYIRLGGHGDAYRCDKCHIDFRKAGHLSRHMIEFHRFLIGKKTRKDASKRGLG